MINFLEKLLDVCIFIGSVSVGLFVFCIVFIVGASIVLPMDRVNKMNQKWLEKWKNDRRA